MQLGEGVEWAVHVLLSLTWLGGDEPVPASKLAGSYGLPQPYLTKQLQALVRAGLLESLPGVRGGFRLARRAEDITLMDVVVAIDGPEDAFTCTEIRQRGMGATAPASMFRSPCTVKIAMRRADLAWRKALAAQTIADLVADVDRHDTRVGDLARATYRTS